MAEDAARVISAAGHTACIVALLDRVYLVVCARLSSNAAGVIAAAGHGRFIAAAQNGRVVFDIARNRARMACARDAAGDDEVLHRAAVDTGKQARVFCV